MSKRSSRFAKVELLPKAGIRAINSLRLF